MEISTSSARQFFVKNCALATVATGIRASSLIELRDKLTTIDESSIYHHFWGERMNPQFVHTQHHNDFAAWVFHRLHDHILAERMSIIDPTEFENLEALRQEIIETIDKRLDDYESALWIKKSDGFHFIRSTIIVFESELSISRPEELPKILPQLPPGSIFYHFIDARIRTPEKVDDFSIWLKMFDGQYEALVERIQSIDPYFLSLTELREELTSTFQQFFNSRGA